MAKLNLNNGPKSNTKNSCYLDALNKISVEDMHDLEQELAYYERISIGFLLFGADPLNSKIVLQKLLVLHRDNFHYNGLIADYAKINPVNWKHCLIEALTVIRSYKILRKLGFNIAELKLCFLPFVPEASLYLHPILKALYNICERLLPAESGKMIKEIKKCIPLENQLIFGDQSYIEIYILHWISIGVIDIGKWDRLKPSLSSNCNIKLIIQQLKMIEKDIMKTMLEGVVRSFNNSDPRNDIQPQKKLLTHQQIPNPAMPSTSSGINVQLQQQQQHQYHQQILLQEQPQQLNIVRDAVTSSVENSSNYSLPQNHIVDDISERYMISKNSAGFILIINQKEFYQDVNPDLKDMLAKEELPVRHGTDQDVEALQSTFQKFGYIPDIRKNVASYDILDIVTQVTKRSIAYQSMIVCILSHGIEGYVYGANSIPVAIQDIEDVLAKAPELLTKPKMVFVQACQGSSMQKTITLSSFQYDGPGRVVNGSGYFDMITAISTIPRFASVRNTENGTWFIQTICKNVRNFADKLHIIDIMTRVIHDISNKRNDKNECMVPRVSQQLTKAFYFPIS